MAHRSSLALTVLGIATAVVFALPQTTFAKNSYCAGDGAGHEGGICISVGNCTTMSVETDDCLISSGNTCCIPPTPPAPVATCASVTGYCFDGDCLTDEDKGVLDCATKLTNAQFPHCCKSRTTAPVAPAGQAASTPGSVTPAAAAPSGIIPASVKNCIETGKCSLDDIVKTGVGFANFIMGLSGALFLAIFIYGGALYLLSFGDKTMVQKGFNAIKGAAIGMIIVLSAWTIVSQIVKGIGANTGTTGAGPAIGGGGGISATACTDKGSEWSCKTFDGSTSAQVVQNASKAGFQCQIGKC